MNFTPTLSVVLLRNAYRQRRHYFLVRTMMVLAVLAFMSCMGTYLLLTRNVETRYLLTTTSGRLVKLASLSAPIHDDHFVTDWAVSSVVDIYTLDFLNSHQQFQRARQLMSKSGFENFMQALKDSGNWRAIQANKFSLNLTPTGRPAMIKKGVFHGRFAWKVQVPVLLTYSSPERSASDVYQATIVVMRAPQYLSPSGLAVTQIILE